MTEKKKTVFLSYSRQDTERVIPLVDALESDGIEVWWDIEIPPGKRFVDVIYKHLHSCDYIIVVWSKSSVRSSWVHREAEEGLQRKVLLPTLFDEVGLPFLFKDLHTCLFQNWAGDKNDQDYQNLLAAINTDSTTDNANHSAPPRPQPFMSQANKAPPHSAEEKVKPQHNTAPSPPSLAQDNSLLKYGLMLVGLVILLGAGYAFTELLSRERSPRTPISTPSQTNTPIWIAANDRQQQNTADPKIIPDGNDNTVDQPVQQPTANPDINTQPPDTVTELPIIPEDPTNDNPAPASANLVFTSSNTVPYEVKARPSLLLRQGPSNGTTPIGSARNGSILFVHDRQGGRITINGKTGRWAETRHPDTQQKAFVFDAYLKPLKAFRVKASPSLRLRSGPDSDSKHLASLADKMIVYPLSIASGYQTINGKRGRWVKLRVNDIDGYVFNQYLEKVNK